MKMTTTRSPKFRSLMRLSGLNKAAAAGTLELLWLFTMEQSPAGDVGKWSDQDLEDELGWEGESGELVEALVASRWLDRCEKHRLLIHDWADHLPDFLQKRVARNKLVLAVLVPTCPDSGGQRPPTADKVGLVPVREGKGREAKGSQGKGRGVQGGNRKPPDPSASPPARANKKSPLIAFPGNLTQDDFDRIAAEFSVDPVGLRERWDSYAARKDTRYTARGWSRVIRDSLRDRWEFVAPLLPDNGGPRGPNGAGPRRVSAEQRRQDELNENSRKALELLGDDDDDGGPSPHLRIARGIAS